jgi:hypothetical protein
MWGTKGKGAVTIEEALGEQKMKLAAERKKLNKLGLALCIICINMIRLKGFEVYC